MKKQADSNWNTYILQKKNVMAMHQQFVSVCILFTPHAQREPGKVSLLVSSYMYILYVTVPGKRAQVAHIMNLCIGGFSATTPKNKPRNKTFVFVSNN